MQPASSVPTASSSTYGGLPTGHCSSPRCRSPNPSACSRRSRSHAIRARARRRRRSPSARACRGMIRQRRDQVLPVGARRRPRPPRRSGALDMVRDRDVRGRRRRSISRRSMRARPAPRDPDCFLVHRSDPACRQPSRRARPRLAPPRSGGRAGRSGRGRATDAHDMGLRVDVWTVDDPDEIEPCRRGRRRRHHKRPGRRARGARVTPRSRSGKHDREGVGLVGDVEVLDVAEVVAVGLVRERPAAHDPIRSTWRWTIPALRRRNSPNAWPTPRRPSSVVMSSDRNAVSASGVEPGVGCHDERTRSEIGVRRGLRDDREVHAVDALAALELDVEARLAAVVVTEPRLDRSHDVQRMRRVALQARRTAPPARMTAASKPRPV